MLNMDGVEWDGGEGDSGVELGLLAVAKVVKNTYIAFTQILKLRSAATLNDQINTQHTHTDRHIS